MYSRRKFIGRSFFVSIASLYAETLMSSCDSNSPTTKVRQPMDTGVAEISPGELQKRKQLGYVAKSPIPDNYCSNCALYLPPKPGEQLGNCQLFKGHVLPGAYCTYWAAPQQ